MTNATVKANWLSTSPQSSSHHVQLVPQRLGLAGGSLSSTRGFFFLLPRSLSDGHRLIHGNKEEAGRSSSRFSPPDPSSDPGGILPC